MIDPERGKNIALLVPYRDDHAVGRGANWAWLKEFWRRELPAAQIVVGDDEGSPFSKACAVNDAFNKSDPGCDVVVILDADAYIDPAVIVSSAEAIREARDKWNVRRWFVPYRKLYRLNESSTAHLIASDPGDALRFATPPDDDDVGPTLGAAIGHRFGALIQIWSRAGFIEVGGMDAAFRGWGGEDVTLVRLGDTLWGIHETTRNAVFTLWHTAIGNPFLRMWAGQKETGVNNALSLRYRETRRDPARMRAVVANWLDNPDLAQHRLLTLPSWYTPADERQ
jgi:hypothetical protein